MNIIMYPKLLILSLVSTFLYSVFIKAFKRIGQTERKLGLSTHQHKTGTRTAGGLIFLYLPLLFIEYSFDILMIVIGTSLYGLLGLVDDVLIVKFKNNEGISPKLKLFLQIIIGSIIFYFYLAYNNPTYLTLFGVKINIKWLYGLLIVWVLVSSTNAWNLIDGVDGLCGGCSLIFGVGLGIIAFKMNELNILKLIIVYHIPIFIFWCLNLPKAFLFMGNVGSLGLGAFYACVSIYLNSLTSYVVMALLIIFETVSVIIQVGYFKKTKGKRLFKMAPFHHHLEKSGLKELEVDLLFYFIQLILVIIVIVSMI